MLALLMVGAALVLGRRPGQEKERAADGASLTARREKLFADLVDIETQRRANGKDPALDARRREVVGKLETVYRELARVEHSDAPPT
jgi:hypothetical protein